MKGFVALLLTLLLMLGVLASCGEQPQEQPVSTDVQGSQSEEPATEPGTEPATEPTSESETEQPPATEEPVTSKNETEYVAPEDGSFTICGTPLSEYSFVLFFPTTPDYQRMSRKQILKGLTDPLASATGLEVEFTVAKNERYDTTPVSEHEILFGSNFRREGVPEVQPKNYYGVTADGTVYFHAISPVLYHYLWECFLEEFFGVAPGSSEASAGCAISECYREIPVLTDEVLKAKGYTQILDEQFDGDALNLDIWEYRGSGGRRGGYNAASQVTVSDGILSLTGEYRTDGEYGEGWYGAMISLKQWYTRGFFEANIKSSLNGGRGVGDFWSAFWIQGPSPYNPDLSQGGIGDGGTEIDIMENFGPSLTTCCVWVSGYEGNTGLDNDLCEVHHLYDDYAEAFHTYALLWDEEVYEFYVDGILIQRTSFGYGTSHVDEQLILSLELSDGFDIDQTEKRIMEVDYVKIWQKN